MSPLGRTFTLGLAITRSQLRVDSNKRDVREISHAVQKLERIQEDLKRKQSKLKQGLIKFYLTQIIFEMGAFFYNTNLFIQSAYAKMNEISEKIFFKIYPDGKKRCIYGKNGKCFSLSHQAESWIFDNSATENSMKVDYLAAKLADSLQSGPRVTNETYDALFDLEKYNDFIEQRYQKSQIRLGEEFFGGPDNYVSISNMYNNSFFNDLSKISSVDFSSLIKPVGKLPKLSSKNISNNFRRPSVFKRRKVHHRRPQAKQISTFASGRKTASVGSYMGGI